MTEALDLVTTFRISALLYLLMSLATWLMLGRPAQWAVRAWCLSGALVSVSAMLITLRGTLNDVWTYPVAQSVLLVSYLLYGQALRMEIGQAWSWRALVAVILLYAGAMAWGFEHRQSWAMAVGVRGANSAALLSTLWASVTLARQTRSRNARVMVAGFALFTASMLTNMVMTWWGFSVLNNLQKGVFNHLNGLVSLLTVLMCYVGYLGLMLERAQNTNAHWRQAQWQALQWAQQAQALTLLDRQRTLAVLANSLGHGIVQPLTATRLQAQLAASMANAVQADPQAADAQARRDAVAEALQNIIKGLGRSATMVERIRGFLQPLPSEPTQVVLQSVLHDAHDLLRQELMHQGVRMTLVLPSQPVHVHAEVLHRTHALVQVIRNAMKAVQGLPRKSVDLSLSVNQHEACIEVVDSGGGLPLRMIDAMNSSAQPLADQHEGLGLYMTRSILAQFQGRLTLENPASGGGCVRLYLPLMVTSQV